MIPVIFSATMLMEGARQIGQATAATPAAADPTPTTWIAAVYMIAVLLIGQIGLWIREVMKYRDFRKKNGDILATKTSSSIAAEKAAEAATAAVETKATIGMMQKNCTETTNRMARAIEANTSRIVDLASKKD